MNKKYLPIKAISEGVYELALLAAENKLELGTYKFDNNVTANVFYTDTQPPEEIGYEAHRKMLDIHMCIEGQEGIGICSLETMRAGEKVFDYDESQDAELYKHNPNGTLHVLNPGDYFICLPEHAHKPGATPPGADTRVKKMLVKAPAELGKR